jgi:hypothetical protein
MCMSSSAQDATHKGANDLPTSPAKAAFRRAERTLFAGGFVLAVALCAAMGVPHQVKTIGMVGGVGP